MAQKKKLTLNEEIINLEQEAERCEAEIKKLTDRKKEVTYSRRLRGGGFSLKHSDEYSINELSPCVPRLCM